VPRRCPSRSQFSWQGACTPCLADEGYPEWSPAGAHSGGAAGWWRFGVGRVLAALGTSPTKICMEWPYLWPTPSSWDGRRSVYSVCSDVACRISLRVPHRVPPLLAPLSYRQLLRPRLRCLFSARCPFHNPPKLADDGIFNSSVFQCDICMPRVWMPRRKWVGSMAEVLFRRIVLSLRLTIE